MGERGPLPTPYARRRNKRHTTGQRVTIARPAMPRSLAPEAKAEWHRVVPQLEEIGMLAMIDRGVLILYCTAWSDWVELDGLLQGSAKLIRGQKGNLVRNPVWLLRRDAEETLVELGRQLGLTPVARLRSGIIHERPPDPEEEAAKAFDFDEYRRRLSQG